MVAQASSLREGRKAIKQHEFDVLLVDLHLGDGEGFELLDYMKTVRPSAEAVVISVMENPAWLKFQQLGPDMQKPLMEKLIADSRPQIEPKIKALEQSIAKRLGIQEGAGAGAPAAGSAVNPAGPFKGSKPPATK